MTAPFVATCVDCDEERAATDPNEIVRFYRRHTSVTGHDVTWTETPEDFDTASEDVPTAVASLVSDPDEGVSLGELSAAMSEFGWTVGETLDAVYDQRMRGALWEPQDDYVSAV